MDLPGELKIPVSMSISRSVLLSPNDLFRHFPNDKLCFPSMPSSYTGSTVATVVCLRFGDIGLSAVRCVGLLFDSDFGIAEELFFGDDCVERFFDAGRGFLRFGVEPSSEI